MNISMIEMVSSHGGMNYYDYGLLDGLGKCNNKVTLYTSSPLLFDVSENKNINVDYVYKGMFETKNKIVRLFKYIWGTFKALLKSKKEKTEIIHFQIFAITYLESFVVWITKLFGFKLIVTVHDVESFNRDNRRSLSIFFYNSVDKIIIHNNVSFSTLCKYFEDFPNKIELKEKCHIIPHGSYIGMLPEKIKKNDAKKYFGISSDTFVFLFFGQIKKVKGLDILLKSYAKLIKNSNKKIKLIIAGKLWKDEPDIYEQIIKEEEINDYLIEDIKYIPDEEIVKYYSAADCIVLPYKKIFQSGVLLMAQSYKVPVIVSDLDGMTEIVSDGENGFVFKTESVEALTNSMKRVIDEKNLELIIENAYAKLNKEYSWETIAAKQSKLMESML